MTAAERSLQEAARLATLREYEIRDTPTESKFDGIAQLAAEICDTPIALISLIDADRQWFKARVGCELTETSLETAFCAWTLTAPDLLEVSDTRSDPRFTTNALVVGEPYARFYAGSALRVDGGYALGAICVIDRQPRTLTPAQRRALRALARHAAAEFELRRYARAASSYAERLRELDVLKDRILNTVGHELRTPLSSIRGYLELLMDEADPLDSATARQFMTVMQRNSERLLHLVDDMLTAAQFRADGMNLRLTEVNLAELVAEVVEESRPLTDHQRVALVLASPPEVLAEAAARQLRQALKHLLLNAVRFTTHGEIRVRVTSSPRPLVVVSDTGVGIAAEELSRLFDPFYRADGADHSAVQGAGLGLTIVRAIVEAHHAEIKVESVPNVGTIVTLTFP
jgi:signal transduction histidine kinase